MRVVSWTLVTRPLLPSIFDSVCSLAQTYDLCSVRQHHPSPSRLLGGVGALGAHTGSLSLPPSLLSRDLLSARPEGQGSTNGQVLGGGRDHGAQSRYWALCPHLWHPSTRPSISAQPAFPLLLLPSLSRAFCLISY